MHTIKAVLFDLDGTLRHNIPNSGDVFSAGVRSLGKHISEEDRERAERWEHFYFAKSLEIQKDFSQHEGDAFWVNFSRRKLIALGYPPKEAAAMGEAVSQYMREHYKPKPRVLEESRELLSVLQCQGYILGVISNRGEPFQEELKELQLDSYFHFSLAGGDINAYKPDRAIFEHGLKLAGVAAQEALYVGDNYFADILGARRAGLTPVLYDPHILFPEAECAVIRSFDEFYALLK